MSNAAAPHEVVGPTPSPSPAPLRTVEEIEKSGVWVTATSGGYSASRLNYHRARGHLKPGRDYFVERVLFARSSGNQTASTAFFYRRSVVDKLLATSQRRRSEKAAARWRAAAQLRDGDEVLLRCADACRLLGVDRTTLQKWTIPTGKGCPYLDNKRLDVVYRHVGGKYLRFWLLSELNAVVCARGAVPAVPAGPGLYTLSEASRLTGLSKQVLRNKAACDRRGIVRTKVAARVRVRRNQRSRYRLEVRLMVAFTKDSVEQYVYLKQNTAIRRDKVTLRQAAKSLGVTRETARDWCKEGLLGSESRSFFDPHGGWSGIVEGMLVSRASVHAMRKRFRGAQTAAEKRAIVARLRRERADARGGAEQNPGDAVLGSAVPAPALPAKPPADGAGATSTGTASRGGRPRNAKVEEVQAYIYDRWIKGDKLAAIRAAVATKYGREWAPKEDSHVSQAARRYAEKHSLSTNRPT